MDTAMQPNVHDAFFTEMLSRPERAASLLQQILPARIQLSSLASCAGSYIDQALTPRALRRAAGRGGRAGNGRGHPPPAPCK